jgi:ATP-dependent phosphoenolpyruvate carboxykinase
MGEIYYISPADVLYSQALRYEASTAIVDSGALAEKSGKKTERSPLGLWSLVQQLQVAEIKGWTPEEVKSSLSMETGSRGLKVMER